MIKKPAGQFRDLSLFLFFLFIASPLYGQITADQINRLKDERVQQLHWLLPTSRAADQDKVARGTIFTEEAITETAKRLNITASDSEVQNFLIPLLARQGLIKVDGTIDLQSDTNVTKWLQGQKWKLDDLYHSGRVLLLWTKIATQSVSVTDDQVKSFVAKHPDTYYVQPRLQVDLSQFDIAQGNQRVARGLLQAEVLAPVLSPKARAATETVPVRAHESLEWQGLRLYLEINRLDPKLRQELQGKRVGYEFGPLPLTDGSIISGQITALLGPADLSKSRDFWQYAVLLTKLENANQKEKFDQISNAYFNSINDPAVRGLFGDILGVVGTGVGALFGGVGAPVGGAIGTVVGGWIDGQTNVQGQQQMPGGSPFSPPPFSPPQGMGPFLGPGTMNMPPVFQGGFPQMPQMNFIPPMPNYYANMYQQMMMSAPPGFGPWGPPVFMPMPVRYY